MRLIFSKLSAFLLLSASVVLAQTAAHPPSNGTKATVIRVANLYIQADKSSSKVGTITPGREMVIVERSGDWLRVFANTDVETVNQQDAPVFGNETNIPPLSGWMLSKGAIDPDTPHGADILFGLAANAEAAASNPNPPPRSAQDARRLYRMVVELFPHSAWVPQAMWRAADIRWQLQKLDAQSLPSAHEKESYLREQLDDSEMRTIQRNFPHTRWAALAAYDQIDNKLCGEWQGDEKCPEKEADVYARYAAEFPDSPRAPEALYQAELRWASAADMWISDHNPKRAEEDRARAKALAQTCETKYGDSDYSARCAGLIYKMEQGIPVYGSDRE